MTSDASDPRLIDLIQVYDEALDADTCRAAVDVFESDASARFRRPATDTWTELIITRNPEPRWREIEQRVLQSMTGALERYAKLPVAGFLSQRQGRAFEHLKIKKYEAAEGGRDRFPLHVDAYNVKTSVRVLAFLWYLNDVEEGGETRFPRLGVSIPPRAGRLVVMPPHWMFEHAGEPPASSDKYIVTSYLNFYEPEDAYRFSYPLA